MPTNRQLKIDLRKEQNHYTRHMEQILRELVRLDPAASLLPLEKAIASRSLIKKLWDLLPGEAHCVSFNNVEEQTTAGAVLLPTTDFTQPVILHLGWDVLAYACSLEAAWHTWPHFATLLHSDTYNCCIYPGHLDWYVVRAGENLYPMVFNGDGYELRRVKGSQ